MRTLRALVAIELAALARIRARAPAIGLALLAAATGGLAVATGLARLRVGLAHGTPGTIGAAVAAAGLGVDLALVLSSLAVGLGAVALVRPLAGRALFLPATRTSAGAVSIFVVSGLCGYALVLGYLRLGPELAGLAAPAWHRAALLAAAVAPAVAVGLVLLPSSVAAVALVARGVPPGRALASALDHVLRRPRLAVALWLLHAALACALVRAALAMPTHLAALAVLPVALAAGLLLAVAAFDAALAGDPRLATG